MLEQYYDEINYDWQAEQTADDYEVERQLDDELEWIESMDRMYAEHAAELDAQAYGERS